MAHSESTSSRSEPVDASGDSFIPADVFELVLSHLTPRDLASAARSCTRWAAAARSESLWRALCLRDSLELRGRDSLERECGVASPGCTWRARYRDEVMMEFDRALPAEWGSTFASPTVLLRFVVIGDSGSGKSCFVLRFADDFFTDCYISTIGVDFKVRCVAAARRWSEVLKLQIWDTMAGAERFQPVTQAMYRGVNGIFFTCDLTARGSLSSVIERVEHMTQSPCFAVSAARVFPPVVILGTKADVEADARAVSAAEGAALARDVSERLGGRPVRYIECSSRTGRGVEQALFALCSEAMRTRAERAALAERHVGYVAAPAVQRAFAARGPGPERGMKCSVL